MKRSQPTQDLKNHFQIDLIPDGDAVLAGERDARFKFPGLLQCTHSEGDN